MPESHVYASASTVDKKANLDNAHKEHAIESTLEFSVNNLQTSKSFIMVRSPELDPKLKRVFSSIKAEVESLVKSMGSQLTDSTLYLFLTSPFGITPYHIDRYSTFLFQLSGTKNVSTWAPWNKDLVSDIEMEKFFAKTHKQAPQYDSSFDQLMTKSTIAPGESLHIPFTAPHMVENGPEVSASLSIIFNTTQTNRKHNALLFNDIYPYF